MGTENRKTPMRRLGAEGPELSSVGLGTWAIGGPWARGWGAQDDSDSIAAIHRALDGGVNWIDTAAVYGRGHAEQIIAAALAERTGTERPLVMTKCGRVETPEGQVRSLGSAEGVRQSVDESRERLHVERLDLLQLHWPPQDVPLEETWTAIAEAKDSGATERIGACNVDLAQLRIIEKIARPDLVQLPLSLVKPESLRELVPYCAERGIGVIAYAPMQSGLLTGKYDATSIARLPAEDWRRTDAEFTEPRLQRNLGIIEVLRGIADDRGCSVGQLAIAWTIAQSGVTGVIVGARDAAQVDGWLPATQLVLSPEELAVLDAVAS